MENTNIENKANFKFAAIGKKISAQIPVNKESEFSGGKGLIQWGDSDDYPNFLFELYNACPILQTIINGSTNFVTGNEVKSTIGFEYPNAEDTWEDLLRKLASDYFIFGICYLQIVRNKLGNPTEFYHLDARYVRSDKKNQIFAYNEDYGKKYCRSTKTIIYPKFIKEAYDIPASVLCIKTPTSRATYGNPIWGSAVKAVMVDTKIDNFHFNELENGFNASAVISFNNGIPSEEQADEMEKDIVEKFCGDDNTGRFLLSFSNGKDNATTVERLSTDDFDDRYESLSKSNEQRIFTAFGTTPAIFGLPLDNIGFSNQEYIEAFKLYNRSRIKPIQKQMVDTFDKVFGVKGSLTIDPYVLEEDDANNEDINIE